MSLFKNAFWQRCYKITTSPLLHTLVVCFFLSLIVFPFCLQIFLRKVFGKKPKLFRTHIRRASLQGFRRLFFSKGSGHHKYVSWGVQEMDGLCFKQIEHFFSTGKTCSCSYYLQHVLESTNSSSSVDTAFYAIKWAHEIVGVASPTDKCNFWRLSD